MLTESSGCLGIFVKTSNTEGICSAGTYNGWFVYLHGLMVQPQANSSFQSLQQVRKLCWVLHGK